MNRDLWTSPIRKDGSPPYPCPSCAAGILTLDKSSLAERQTAASNRDEGEDWWEPDHWRGRFTAFLHCTNPACHDSVAVSGTVSWDPTFDDELGQWVVGEQYSPRGATPPPPIIHTPLKTPEPVVDHLQAAFEVFWSDPSSAGNRIRTAIEALLDERRIPRRIRAKKGVSVRLDLHKRIERFKQQKPDLAEKLLAVKWLGNAGSHASLTKSAVLDAFEIVEFVLENLYSGTEARVSKLAKSINRARGPI